MQNSKTQYKLYQRDEIEEEALFFSVGGYEHKVKRYLHNKRYEVKELIAIGGMGCIFLATDSWNYHRKVVIKTPNYMGDYCRPYITRSQSVFQRQLKSLNRFYSLEKKHLIGLSNAGFDSIVHLNDSFQDLCLDLCEHFRDAAGVQYRVDEELRNYAPYLVLKYVPGKVLNERLRKKKFSEIKTLRLAKQILILMKSLHQPRKSKKGRPFYYLLCDLKADNVMIDGEQIVLIDFGAIKTYWIDQKEIDIPIFVTDGYAAPEVYSGTIELKDNPRIDCRFDIFTVGALMAECLTGKSPNTFLVNFNPPQHQFDLPGSIDVTVQKIIAKATHEDKNKRYQDADGMLSDVLSAIKKLQP